MAALRYGICRRASSTCIVGRQVAVFEDELEQHADQVDGVLVDVGHVAGSFATQRSDLGQQLLLQLDYLAAELDRIVRSRVLQCTGAGDLALQHAQRAEQLVGRWQGPLGPDSRPRGCRRRGRAAAGTEQRVQGLQQVAGDIAVSLATSAAPSASCGPQCAGPSGLLPLGLGAAQHFVAQAAAARRREPARC